MPMLAIEPGSMVSMSGCCRRRTTWVVPPPHTEIPSSRVSLSTSAGSKRPSGHTVGAPVMTVETAIDMPDTWNSGYGARRTVGGGASVASGESEGRGDAAERCAPAIAMPRAAMNDCSIR